MRRSLAQFVIFLVSLGTTTEQAAGAESADSVNVGFGGIIRTMPHCDANVYFAEYEHAFTPTTTLLGRVNKVGYKFDDGNYREDGTLRGLDVGARYYPAGNMRGFFVGGSLGAWNGDWTFSHSLGRPGEDQGKARSHAARLNFDLGARIPLQGSPLAIMPEMNVGKFFSSRSCEYTSPPSLAGTACNQKSEVNVYFFVGVAAGLAF